MKHRNSEIDFLRAYAVSAVLLLHVIGITYPHFMHHDWPGIVYGFEAGVDVFFVISGFVISDAYRRLAITGAAGADLYRDFMVRRLARLWPAAAFWLSYCLAASFFFKQERFFPPPFEVFQKVLAGLLYVFNFAEHGKASVLGYFWSLSVEWQFYLVLPAVLLFKYRVRIALLIMAFAILTLWHPGGSDWWMFRFDGILIGILLYELREKNLLQKFLPTRMSATTSAAITLLLLAEIVIVGQFMKGAYLGLSFQCLCAGALVALATQENGSISAFGLNAVVRWVGLRSYSIYLCHIPVTLTILSCWDRLALPGGWIRVSLTSVAVTALVSELSYRALELGCSRRLHESLSECLHPHSTITN
ncbi:acyltransferase [Burkholderia multivorans]|nr:acyltransferase [Burkholderia multivorans]